MSKKKDYIYEVLAKLVATEHLQICIFFVFIGFILILIRWINAYPILNDIWSALGISFLIAGFITIVYDYLLLKDTGKIIATYLLLDEVFVNEILNKIQANKIVTIVLQNYLGKEIGNLVKTKIIDNIEKNNEKYIFSSHTLQITLKNVEGDNKDFFQLNVRESFFQKVHTDQIKCYAITNTEMWRKKVKEHQDLQKGIELVWKIPDKLLDEVKRRYEGEVEDNSEIFELNFYIDKIKLSPINGKKFYEDLVDGQKYYYLEFIYDVKTYKEINKHVEHYLEFNALKDKLDHHFYVQIPNAYKTFTLNWDCDETNVRDVKVYTSIEDDLLHHLNDSNKKYLIQSSSNGLPGQYIFFIWSLN